MASKNYSEAIAAYGQALAIDKDNVALLANRALAHLNCDRFQDCISDCDAVLKLDKSHVKALLRRATAFQKLNRLDAATTDLSRVLEVEPSNAAATELLATIRKAYSTKWAEKSQLRTQRLATKPVVSSPESSGRAPTLAGEIKSSIVVQSTEESISVLPEVKTPSTSSQSAASSSQSEARREDEEMLRQQLTRHLGSFSLELNAVLFEAAIVNITSAPVSYTDQYRVLFDFLHRRSASVFRVFRVEQDDATLTLFVDALAFGVDRCEANVYVCCARIFTKSKREHSDASFVSDALIHMNTMPRLDLFCFGASARVKNSVRSLIDRVVDAQPTIATRRDELLALKCKFE